MKDITYVQQKVTALEAKYAQRDGRYSVVRAVREGRLAEVFPDYFDDGTNPYPMVSNFLDVVARDYAESLGPLPALNCSSGLHANDRARKFAGKRTKVGLSYWAESNLERQMFEVGDHFVTYGAAYFTVEPDFAARGPRIRTIHPVGAYPEFDRDRNVVAFVRKFRARLGDLLNWYPDAAMRLTKDVWDRPRSHDTWLTVIRYEDAECYALYTEEGGVALEQWANPTGRCNVVAAVRPSHDEEIRGQFDDVIGVQGARAIMMRLAVEAAEKAVQAPIAMPDDVNELTLGPDAFLRSSQPQNIRRVDLRVDGSTFAELGTLQQELASGSRYSALRQGQSNASIITGRGVEALLGGFDTQIKAGQVILASALRTATSLAFQMDEKLWGGLSKKIRGVQEGAPFEEEYDPAKDIKGDHTCDVTYGFLAGMDPNRALVFLLQLRGDKAIDRATLQKHMPFDVDVNELQQNLDVEELRDSLMAGVQAYVQALGPLASQGQNPSEILQVIAAAVKGRQKGDPVEDVILGAFNSIEEAKRKAAEEAMAQAQAQGAEASLGGVPGPGGGLPPGLGPDGLMDGVAPGQAGMPPGGKPDIQMLMAGLAANGDPSLRAGVRRMLPV